MYEGSQAVGGAVTRVASRKDASTLRAIMPMGLGVVSGCMPNRSQAIANWQFHQAEDSLVVERSSRADPQLLEGTCRCQVSGHENVRRLVQEQLFRSGRVWLNNDVVCLIGLERLSAHAPNVSWDAIYIPPCAISTAPGCAIY